MSSHLHTLLTSSSSATRTPTPETSQHLLRRMESSTEQQRGLSDRFLILMQSSRGCALDLISILEDDLKKFSNEIPNSIPPEPAVEVALGKELNC
ncbi:hypothetical protein Droror1_Dr00023508 [Drosera rotundifolia]